MFQPQYNNLAIDKKMAYMPVNTVLETRINSAQPIKKVLCINANPQIVSSEALNGEALVNGKATLRVLAITDDDRLTGLTYNADFSERVKGDITPKARLFWDVHALETNHEIDNGGISVNMLLEITGEGVMTEEQSVLTGGEGLMTLTETATLSNLVVCQRLDTLIENEIQVSQSINRILLAESFVTINDYFVNNDVLTINGTATVGIIYVSDDDTVVSKLSSFDFTQEVAVKGISSDYALSLNSRVASTKIRMDVVEDLPTTSFIVEIDLDLLLCAYSEMDVDVIKDVYSLTHNLETSSVHIKTTMPGSNQYYEFNSTAGVGIDEVIDRFIAVANLSTYVSKVSTGLGSAEVEGYTSGVILYEKDNEISSSTFEIPFSHTIEGDWIGQESNLKVNASIGDISYRLEKQEAVITVKIGLSASGTRESSFSAIESVKEGEPVSTESGAIEVVLAHKGDTLWDIAKWLHMRQEDILAVNPDIVSPLEEDAKIVVYHRI
jgi:hypothetical protein